MGSKISALTVLSVSLFLTQPFYRQKFTNSSINLLQTQLELKAADPSCVALTFFFLRTYPCARQLMLAYVLCAYALEMLTADC